MTSSEPIPAENRSNSTASAATVAVSRAPCLRRALAAFALALFATTWRLWTPQDVFPQVPAFRWITGLPAAWQWVPLVALIGSLAAALVAPKSARLGRRSLLAFALAAVLLMAGDQHRWQPWAWQMLLTALALGALPPASSWRLLRWLTVSIYVYSAWSKCDITFLDTLGQQFLRALAGPAAGWLDGWPLATRRVLAGGFVAAEFLLAAALLWPRSRRWGLAGAVASHVLLIWILGPWGLAHRPPVLIWNAWFIVQDLLLFAGPLSCSLVGWRPFSRPSPHPAEPSAEPTGSPPIRFGGQAVQGLLWLALLLPLLQPFGLCDPWFAWALYAPRVEWVRILISRSQEQHIRADADQSAAGDMARYLVPLVDEPDWLELRADRWSLGALGAPLYPSNRFQLGVALAVAERYSLASGLTVICLGPADRLSGARLHTTLTGVAEIQAACDAYWLNAQPR